MKRVSLKRITIQREYPVNGVVGWVKYFGRLVGRETNGKYRRMKKFYGEMNAGYCFLLHDRLDGGDWV